MSGPANALTFSGKVVFITGGGTGIGRGIADAFAAARATVVVAGRRAEPLEDFCLRNPGNSDKVQMNVGDDEDRQRGIDTVVRRYKRLDVLVNNALAVYDRPFSEMTLKQMEITYRVLLLGPTRLTQLAAPHLIETGGNVINIFSVSARYIAYPVGGVAVYSAAKAGLERLTRALAAELGFQGMRVNAIAPGATKSESKTTDPNALDKWAADTPLGRMGEPADIASVALFLASPAAAWVTGQVIDTSGGGGSADRHAFGLAAFGPRSNVLGSMGAGLPVRVSSLSGVPPRKPHP